MLKKWLPGLREQEWQAEACSEVGPHKETNEDHTLLNLARGLAVVCDGVGGQGNGDLASGMACAFLDQTFSEPLPGDDSAMALRQRLRQCHQHLLAHMEAHPHTNGMATTLVMALKDGNHAWIAWAGDSRAYLLRRGQLTALTDDHSFVNEKVAQGVLNASEADSHPMAHLITSSLGGAANSLKRIGIEKVRLHRGDRLILCSDGVYGYMSQAQLLAAAIQGARALVEQAIHNDTVDNCSAIGIDIH